MSEPLAVIRASAWPDLFDCAYRFYWKQIVGLKKPSSPAAYLGTSIHAGAAAFDQARMIGKPIKPDDAAGVSLDKLNNPEEEVLWDEDLTKRDAQQYAVGLTAKYCGEVAPKREYRAVELLCEALDIATEHGVVRVTGTTDRVRSLPDGREGISDLKSGAHAVGTDGRAVTKGHHLQLGIYQLMAEQATGITMTAPAEVIGLQTSSKGRVGTGEVGDVKTPLLGTPDQPGLIQHAAAMLKSGLFPPNAKSMLCSEKYCPAYSRCIYHD
ncbi:MAG TPA: PD-(D/E)XK nuclease family protein [Nevskia sp.]|nr:PD-(D/E)XK nuclease family protein [Nevskia sp.]